MPSTGDLTDPLPYCGAPPLPGGVVWRLDDPWLLGALALGLALAWRRAADRRALALGWALLAGALVSPLCNLSVALFSARAGQHLLVLLGAAPLLAAALPKRARTTAGEAAASGLLFAAALWAWHLPGPYAATFRSDAAYWAMHLSLLGAAWWLWRGLLGPGAARPEAALLGGLATASQMGALGALLTFAPRALYAPHAHTTLPWGLTQLEDQQLGGLLMWVPGGLAFAAVAVPALLRVVLGTETAPTPVRRTGA